MPCNCDGYPSPAKYLMTRLCAACKFLTREQIESIKPNDSIVGLLEIYANHLFDDWDGNKEHSQEESEAALKEAHRIGVDFEKQEGGGYLLNYHWTKKVYPY